MENRKIKKGAAVQKTVALFLDNLFILVLFLLFALLAVLVFRAVLFVDFVIVHYNHLRKNSFTHKSAAIHSFKRIIHTKSKSFVVLSVNLCVK